MTIWCSNCGEQIQVSQGAASVVCPKCNTEVKVPANAANVASQATVIPGSQNTGKNYGANPTGGKKNNIKIIAIILAIIAVISVAAVFLFNKDEKNPEDGNSSEILLKDKSKDNDKEDDEEEYEDDVEIPEGQVLPDDAELSIVIASHPSWPYDDSWAVWENIEEAMGGDIDVTAIPSSDFGTKFPILMTASDEIPDVFGFQSKPSGFASYCAQDAFISFDDCERYMPDYISFWDSLPEKDQWMKNTRKSADGKIYYSPVYGAERTTNIRAWLYRKDIFESHGIAVPTTMDELYATAKKLKALYPDSYPLCMRSGFSNINVIGSSWKPNFHYNLYYDFEADKWCYGATEDTMKEIVIFFNKMVSEGLIPTDFMTISSMSWEELVTTNRGFIMPEYQVRIDYFNSLARASNPGFNLTAMIPPHANNGVGVAMVNKYNNDPSGMAICNTGDANRVANAARYINWFYTDEAAELVSWGKEGETYTIDAGKKNYILDYGATTQTQYGFKTIGTYCRLDPAAIDASASEEQTSTTDFILGNTYPYLDPTSYIELSDADSRKVGEIKTSVETVVQEGLMKFILGARSISEWDAFQEELKALPIDEMLAIYEKYDVVR